MELVLYIHRITANYFNGGSHVDKDSWLEVAVLSILQD